MTEILDIDSIEGIAVRAARKRTPMNTDPLSLDKSERDVVDDVAEYIGQNLRIKSLSTYNQMLTFHAAIEGMEAALNGQWAAIAAAAEAGLRASFEVHHVNPYLIWKQDGAKRNLASDQRNALKDIALRLSHASRAETRVEADRAFCLRAMTYAAIAADRGLLHIVKDNFGAVINTLHADDFPARGEIVWTDGLNDLARRYRTARVRMP